MPSHTRYCILMPTVLLLALIACQSQSVLVEGSTSGTVAATSDSHSDSHHSSDSHDDSHDDHAGHDHGGHDDHGHHGHGLSEADAMKVMSIIVITVCAWIVDVLVLAFPKISQHKKVISIVSCIGGGMFAVISLAHLLAEGSDIFKAHYAAEAAHGHGGGEVVERFRPAEMIALAGYFLMLFMQKGIFNAKTQKTEGDEAKDKEDIAPAAGATGAPASEEEGTATTENPLEPEGPQVVTVVAVPSKQSNQEEDDDETKRKQKGEVVGLGVLFATLMIHGVTEGLALGLQHSKEGVIVIFVAIMAHHWAMDLIFTFATGKLLKKIEQPPLAASPADTAMVAAGTTPQDRTADDAGEPVSTTPNGDDAAVPLTKPRLSFGLRVFLSFVCSSNVAFGIAIGWGLQASVPGIVTAYVLSFCAGTFFFFAFSEIVPQEMPEGTGRRLPELLAFFLGMAVIYATLAGIYSPEAHNHGGDGHAGH